MIFLTGSANVNIPFLTYKWFHKVIVADKKNVSIILYESNLWDGIWNQYELPLVTNWTTGVVSKR